MVIKLGENLTTTTLDLKNSCKLWVYVHNHNTAVCNITYMHHPECLIAFSLNRNEIN